MSETRSGVAKVIYPGLIAHPQHELAARQMQGGFGGMVTVILEGDLERTKRVLERVQVFTLAESLGGVEGKETRNRAVRWNPLLRRQRSPGRIDREHADAVVAAVGDIDMAAVATDPDLGAGAVAGESVRAGRSGLQGGQYRA